MAVIPVQAEPLHIPLVVDLDGTLVLTDTLHESALALVRDRPLAVPLLLWWLLHGKLRLKSELAGRTSPSPAYLPWNDGLVEFLRHERARGRRLVLATASRREVAENVAEHLGLFDQVLGSSDTMNLKGAAKREELVRLFGVGGFDYVGDSLVDIPVWTASRMAHVAGRMQSLPKTAFSAGVVEGRQFPVPAAGRWPLFKALRARQWVKNLLVFLPALLNHHFSLEIISRLTLAFLSFSLVASSVYLVNDLFDLESDRRHPRKRSRPLAAGTLSIPAGVLAAATTLFAGLLLASQLGPVFVWFLSAYGATAFVYSVFLKHRPILDVVVLAVFYTARIYAGGIAANVWISPWLVQFSIFLFLSLAFVKRYSELHRLSETEASATGNDETHMRRTEWD